MRIGIVGSIAAAELFAAAPLLGQAATACGRDQPVRAESRARLLHPDEVEARYAQTIVAQQWMNVLNALQDEIRTTYQAMGGAAAPLATAGVGATPFTTAATELQSQFATVMAGLPAALDAPLAERAAKLRPLEINRFTPTANPVTGAWQVLMTSDRPRGFEVGSPMTQDEMEAICYAARAVSRLLNGANNAATPLALARITKLSAEWERYRWSGPLQLPHELLLNRALRGFHAAGFEPPTFDLVVIHPFAAVELTKGGNGVKNVESLAAEIAGGTLWLHEWKDYVGGSLVVASDANGRLGYGPLVRASKYATGGVVWRKGADGVTRTTLLLTVDALRLFESDGAAKGAMQLHALTGALLNRGEGR